MIGAPALKAVYAGVGRALAERRHPREVASMKHQSALDLVGQSVLLGAHAS